MISSGLWDRFRGSREENCDTGLSERSVRKRGRALTRASPKRVTMSGPAPFQFRDVLGAQDCGKAASWGGGG